MLGAAASIDAAAKKLASLRPRQHIKVIVLFEILNYFIFDGNKMSKRTVV